MVLQDGDIPTAAAFNDVISEAKQHADDAATSETNSAASATAAAGSVTDATGLITQATILGNIYPDMTTANAAITAGTIPSGALFQVASTTATNYVDRYINVSGVATYDQSYPNKAAIDAASAENTAAIAAVQAENEAAVDAVAANVDSIVKREAKLLGLREAHLTDGGQLGYGLNDIGEFLAGQYNINQFMEVNSGIFTLSEDVPGYRLAAITAGKQIVWGITSIGEFTVGPYNVNQIFAAGSSGGASTVDVNLLKKWMYGTTDIVCWGDSLSAYPGVSVADWPTQLGTLLGVGSSNQGIGGQSSSDISARQGGYPTYLTMVGGGIPTSGAVAVATRTRTPLTDQGTQTIAGTIGGIHGTLTRLTDGSYTFNRTTAGDAYLFVVPKPFYPDVSDYDFRTNIIWVGRNDYTNPTLVLSNVDRMVDFIKVQGKRFIVMPPPNGNYSGEQIGGNLYAYFTTIRDGLRDKYPDNFLDIWQIWVESYDPSQSQDVIDHTNGITPTSKRVDNVHPNDDMKIIIANTLYQFFKEKGWAA